MTSFLPSFFSKDRHESEEKRAQMGENTPAFALNRGIFFKMELVKNEKTGQNGSYMSFCLSIFNFPFSIISASPLRCFAKHLLLQELD